jgi:hypothetical protein
MSDDDDDRRNADHASPEHVTLRPPDMERVLAVIHAELGPTILPRETDPVVGALWLAELGNRRSRLAERLQSEADALMHAASALLRIKGRQRVHT